MVELDDFRHRFRVTQKSLYRTPIDPNLIGDLPNGQSVVLEIENAVLD